MSTQRGQTTRTRGRPRKFDRDAALIKAKRAFHSRGYERVSVADLATEMGINPPSFYSAFGSKAQLFEEVAEHYVRDQGSFGMSIAQQAQTLDQWVEPFLKQAIEVYTADPECRGCLISAHLAGSDVPEAQSVCQPFQRATLAGLTTTAQRLGHPRPLHWPQ